MQDYDIRIFNDAGHFSLCVAGRYFSDAAAIRAAKEFCRDHDSVEVWNGRGRVFAQTSRSPDATTA